MRFAVIGAGLMGRAAVYDLARAEGVVSVVVFDINEKEALSVAEQFGAGKTEGRYLDVANVDEKNNPLDGFNAVISAVTYRFNPSLTKLAISAGASFFDLGGNNDTVAEQFKLNDEAVKADVVVIPDCGLAPGMVSVLAAAGVREFDTVDSLKIRVGGLPQNPVAPLNYQMVFSAEGLINEYWEPVVILKDGEFVTVDPMSAVEELEFPKLGKLEAFYTSGGTSTLPQTFRNKIGFLDYKTIRYPGHCALFKPMLELGLASRDKLSVAGQEVEPRALFKAVLDKNLNFNDPDIVLVRVELSGAKDGAPKKLRFQIDDRQDEATGLTAMMRMTAFPIAIIAWMAASGKINSRGVVPQELAVDPDIFIAELEKRNVTIERYDDF
ncbi:saccharopine dehydrogenase NADP-binding domain-containing protein [bacterium AH-315-F03]|nr:saccharopine dehydrogenase NADP-binding domain-containing protein [bacterium AH-315-F03]